MFLLWLSLFLSFVVFSSTIQYYTLIYALHIQPFVLCAYSYSAYSNEKKQTLYALITFRSLFTFYFCYLRCCCRRRRYRCCSLCVHSSALSSYFRLRFPIFNNRTLQAQYIWFAFHILFVFCRFFLFLFLFLCSRLHFGLLAFCLLLLGTQAQEDNKVIPFILYFQTQNDIGPTSLHPSFHSATLNLFRYFM